MPYSTREVSDLVTDDRLEVGASRANFSGLKKLVLLGAATLMIGGCLTPKGRNFVDNMGYTAAGTFIQESIKKEMGHSDYQVPTGGDSVLNPSTPQTRRNDYPIFFNAANETTEGYSDIRDIFYPGENIWVVTKPKISGKITNFVLALDKNEQIPEDLVNGSDKIKVVFKCYLTPGNFAYGKFNASKLKEEYGNNFRVYWLLNDKIIGSRDFVIMNERPEQYSSSKN